MIKALILMNLVFFSFEIDHCLEVVPRCKKCITGYKLYDSLYDKYCQKEEDSYNYDNIEHCLYSSGNTCYNCQSGYARTTDGSCKENPIIHCDLFEGENCIKCENYYKLVEGRCEKSTCREDPAPCRKQWNAWDVPALRKHRKSVPGSFGIQGFQSRIRGVSSQ